MKKPFVRIATAILLGIVMLIVSAGEQSKKNIVYVEKRTSLIFPPKIGVLAYQGTKDFGDERLGVAIRYGNPEMWVDIYVYNLGLSTIPSEPESSVIKDEFDTAINDIKEYSRRGVYPELVLGQQELVALADGAGGPRARYVSLTYTLEGISCHSHLFVLGYKNQFIKVRFSYKDDVRIVGEQQARIQRKWLSDAIQESN